MGVEARKPKPVVVNPNWAQLQQKLKTQGASNPRRPSTGSDSETLRTVLGKRKERSNAEESEEGSAASVLAPINDDCSLTDVVAMDCEMVGVSLLGNKSALGHVTLVNAWGNIVYNEYVRPVERVVDFRTEISGIRPRDLKKAKDFRVVQKKVAELLQGRILVGHALRNDLKALLLSHPRNDIRDTSEYQPFLKEGRKRALRHLAEEYLGIKIQHGEHCPVEDARSAMLLYQRNKKEWEKSLKAQLRFKKKNKNCKQNRETKVQ